MDLNIFRIKCHLCRDLGDTILTWEISTWKWQWFNLNLKDKNISTRRIKKERGWLVSRAVLYSVCLKSWRTNSPGNSYPFAQFIWDGDVARLYWSTISSWLFPAVVPSKTKSIGLVSCRQNGLSLLLLSNSKKNKNYCPQNTALPLTPQFADICPLNPSISTF